MIDRLSIDQVNTAADALTSRVQTAIASVTDNLGLMDKVFGKSDATAASLRGLEGILDPQIPSWRRIGLNIAQGDDESRVDEWLRIGKNIQDNVDGYDGLGKDYALSSIAAYAVTKTVTDAKEALPAVGLGLAGILVAVGLVAVAIILVEIKR